MEQVLEDVGAWQRIPHRDRRTHAAHNQTANRPERVRAALIQSFHVAKRNARNRRIPFGLTKEEFLELVDRADGRCEVSGLPFDLRYWKQSKRRPFAPSLDRIDATRAYTKRNCRLVCGIVNAALSDWGEEPFRMMVAAMKGPLPGTFGTVPRPQSA